MDEAQKQCLRCLKILPIANYAIRTDARKLCIRGVCKHCYNERTRNIWRKLRIEIFDYYGWMCKCCGEKIKEFLSLDHINDDGYLDKNPNGNKKSGKELYLLVKKQGFPNKYQTLCMNCNWGKKLGHGICPHKK
jgi:hypothetical protein